MRKLVVCCDGTWNTGQQRSYGVPTPTNVWRLFCALTPNEREGSQVKLYQTGVGAEGGLITHLLGGGLGKGLERNIIDAYQWIASRYRRGDEISLFGFSRGAYTVRNLAAWITRYGLPDYRGVTDAEALADAREIYQDGYHQNKDPGEFWRQHTEFPRRHPVSVRFLGVWDTVGAMGIPRNAPLISIFDFGLDRFEFNDTVLNPPDRQAVVEHARHAVALDEERGPFAPTLWSDNDPRIKQVWFVGNHSDVGGGHRESGLSDVALRWMVAEAKECAGLSFDEALVSQIAPDPCGVLHDDLAGGVFQNLAPRPRSAPLCKPDSPSSAVHSSVHQRQRHPSIITGDYRKTSVLTTPGEPHPPVVVKANKPWNETGIWLEPAKKYKFEATGVWVDRSTATGPDGIPAADAISEDQFLHAAGRLLEMGQGLYQWATGNPAAKFAGTRRVPWVRENGRKVDVPWMCLVGVLAHGEIDPKTGLQQDTEFKIGKETVLTVPAEQRGGYLYAFANDAWGFYASNQGSVQLTVTPL